jgi:hypothetical protein
MLKKIGLPIIALLALLVFITPAPAHAGVRFGVAVGPAYPYGYAYPYTYPYAYANPYYYNGYPAYPYVAPGVGLGFSYWGGGGHGYYRAPAYRGGGGWHGQAYRGGGHGGGYRGR